MSLRTAPRMYGHIGHDIHTPPTVEPVSADQFRSHIKATEGEVGDDEALMFIGVAREHIEANAGIALVTQSWILSLDEWPKAQEEWWSGVRQGSISEIKSGAAPICLPRSPVQTVDSVAFHDESGDPTFLDVAATFDVDTHSKPARMAVKSGKALPPATRAMNSIEIVYTCGYGDTGAAVPSDIKMAILQFATRIYTKRGDDCTVGDLYADSGAESLISKYNVARV